MDGIATIFKETVQQLAFEVAALRDNLRQDPLWCECTRTHLQDVWGGQISPNDFPDQFVQAVTISLFLARISLQHDLSEENLEEMLPPNIPVLSEILRALRLRIRQDSKVNETFSNLLQIINSQSLSQSPSLSELPFSIYLYEHLLKAFSTKTRRERGTFYTPLEVVQFIVQSVQYILRKDLGLSGFCDFRTRLLDFSAGTGAFLLGAIKKAVDETSPEANKDIIIREKILPHFVGLEPYLAPNVIAQLNVVKLLQDSPIKYVFSPDEHLRLYPINTLESPEKGEIFASTPIPSKIIPIILGNPPYSADSQNNSHWIRDLLALYKEGLGEKNLKPLNDDYVKFIRYAQWRVEQAGQGIIGLVTNKSFLDGLVHRVMRASLFHTFDRLYLLNLHGHQREDGDESVFDIQKVGVVIIIGCKFSREAEKKEVLYYSSLDHGIRTRIGKLDFLRTHSIEDISWITIPVRPPDYWFVPRSSREEVEYQEGWGLDEIFETYTSGIETGNDLFYTSFPTEKETLVSRVREVILSQDELAVKKKFKWLDTTNHTFEKLRAHGRPGQILSDICFLHYRPLDFRWCYYARRAMSRDRYAVMQHLIGPEKRNLALISVRQVSGQDLFTHVLVTDTICDNRIMKSTKGKAYIFPLFLHTESRWIPNFRREFLQSITNMYGTTPDAEELFAFIYAVLNSSIYRKRHAIQLRKNFPRVLFVRGLHQLKAIAKQGKDLINAHLFRTSLTVPIGIRFNGNDNSVIKRQDCRYDPVLQRLFINEIDYWEGISSEIWNMQIGGWSVLSHWLNERDRQPVGVVYRQNFEQILCALKFTQESIAIIENLLSEGVFQI